MASQKPDDARLHNVRGRTSAVGGLRRIPPLITAFYAAIIACFLRRIGGKFDAHGAAKKTETYIHEQTTGRDSAGTTRVSLRASSMSGTGKGV